MLSLVIVCSVIIDGFVVHATGSQSTRRVIKRSAESEFHRHNATDCGYYSGRTVVKQEKAWFVQDSPTVQKKIINEHMMNVYDVAGLEGLQAGVPAFVQTTDGMWYKIDDPSPELRQALRQMNYCLNETNTPHLKPEDFKPAIVELVNDGGMDFYQLKGAVNPHPKCGIVGACIGSPVTPSYHQYNGSDVGYMTGYTVVYREDSKSCGWFVKEGQNKFKQIVAEHIMNVYDPKEMGLRAGIPAFVRTEDDKWVKIEDPPEQFRRYVATAELCIDTDQSPFLGVDDFRPAHVKIIDGYVVDEGEKLAEMNGTVV